MRRTRQEWSISLVVGLTIASLVTAAAALFPQAVDRTQAGLVDFLFFKPEGPGLARRVPADDLLLVLFDLASANELGGLPTAEQDLALYRGLLQHGAQLVVDTRMIAAFDGERLTSTRALLDGMLEIDRSGRLIRDVWLPDEQMSQYRAVLAHNLPNFHPVADADLDGRLYPLAASEMDGAFEALALRMARWSLKLPPAQPDAVRDEIKRAGISAVWQRQLDKKSLPDLWRADNVDASPYRLATREIAWRPFVTRVEVVPPAAFWIDYSEPPEKMARLPYYQADRADVQGKIVLIGYDAAVDPTSDTYSVPTSSTRAGLVEVTAAALQTLRSGRIERLLPRGLVMVSTGVAALLAALAGGVLRPLAASLLLILMGAAYLVGCIALQAAQWRPDLFLAPTAGLLAGLGSGGLRYAAEIRARTRIIDLFGRYVPRAVVAQLVQLPTAQALALGGVKREVTVLFADVRGFTSFAERSEPEVVLDQLNSLLQVMVHCTFAHEGTVDKFIGDAILVLFNAPLDQADHTVRAARTAAEIQAGLEHHPSGLAVGIGIHRGQAVVGSIGTPQRMEYTAVGSTVNLASRLCGLAQSREIVVSAEVAAELSASGEFDLVPRSPVAVKGLEGQQQTFLLRPRMRARPEAPDRPA